MNDKFATLVYDGDCGICKEWVDHWHCITGDRVIYRPYQQVADQFPGISLQSFEESIQLIEADGEVSSGAEATFRLYRHLHPYSLLLLLYRYLPGFRPLTEFAYGFFSRHRGLLAAITHLFWGRNFRPPEYQRVSRIFLICLGLIYFSAFLSFSLQAQGLIGSHGILPLHFYLERLAEHYGGWAYLNAPMIFWFNASNPAIQLTSIAGCVLSVLLIFNRARLLVLIALYVLYLSLYYAGQVFMSFQWDILLLEAGFLAIFLGRGSRIVVWLYRWLVFRFMLLGGLVKLASRDPTWDNLTALFYHFETQPLPAPLAWHAHHLPETVLMALVVFTMVTELLVPFLIFTPRRFRILGAWIIMLFQFGIILTGNYNFFNLLTISLCLFLFDDAALGRIFRFARRPVGQGIRIPVNTGLVLRSLFAAIMLYATTDRLLMFFTPEGERDFAVVTRVFAVLNAANNYGPFAVMTTERNEIIIEGSMDGRDWQPYLFKHKPDALDKPLRWIIPHQPRLDWQMWFAALSTAERQHWFRRLLYQCLEGRRAVLELFRYNPFADKAPTWIRAGFYRYTFTSTEQRRRTGNVWNRQYLGEYLPAFRLQSASR